MDLPVNQISAEIDAPLLDERFGIKMPSKDFSGIADAVKMIKECQKPVIFADEDVISTNASDELVHLAEILKAPMVTLLMEIFSNADLIITVGTKFFDRTYFLHTNPGNRARSYR